MIRTSVSTGGPDGGSDTVICIPPQRSLIRIAADGPSRAFRPHHRAAGPLIGLAGPVRRPEFSTDYNRRPTHDQDSGAPSGHFVHSGPNPDIFPESNFRTK
ncbi:hypothetical protein GCM10027271_53950 [Saccharopolyspora gloriosae]